MFFFDKFRRWIEESDNYLAIVLNIPLQISHWMYLSLQIDLWKKKNYFICFYAFVRLLIRGRMFAREYFIYNLFERNTLYSQLSVYSQTEFIKVFKELNIYGYNTEHSKYIGDKFLLYSLLTLNEIATPKIYAQLNFLGAGTEDDEKLLHLSSEYEFVEFLKKNIIIQKNGFVVKPRFGTGGYGIFIFKTYNPNNELLEYMDGKRISVSYFCKILKKEGFKKNLSKEMSHPEQFLIQERVKQHSETSKWNPNSLNTIRIYSFTKEEKLKILLTIFRIGVKDTFVDNSSQGGIMCFVKNNKGELYPSGYVTTKKGLMSTIYKHPDSNIYFKGQSLPNWQEILCMIEKTKSLLTLLPSIAYDIAISENGPMVIEINSITQIGRNQFWPNFMLSPNYFIKE